MQIGWIDFSKSDRDKVLGVIQLFAEQTAMDELGIGTMAWWMPALRPSSPTVSSKR